MKKYLNESEHQALRRKVEYGDARIRISRSVARQFFTRVDNASIIESTGESMLFEKAVVWLGILLPIVALGACLVSIIYFFGWMATVAVPLAGIFWTILAGLTGEDGTISQGTIGLGVAVLLAIFIPPAFAVPLVLFAISLWIHRSNYALAEYWVTALVARSFPAYDMLVEHLEIEEFQDSDQPARDFAD